MLSVLMVSLINALIVYKYNSRIDGNNCSEAGKLKDKSLFIGLLAASLYIISLVRWIDWHRFSWKDIVSFDLVSDVMTEVFPLVLGVIIDIVYLRVTILSAESKGNAVRNSMIAVIITLLVALLYFTGSEFFIESLQLDFMHMARFNLMYEVLIGSVCCGYIIGKLEISSLRVPPMIPDLRVRRILCRAVLIAWGLSVLLIYKNAESVCFGIIMYGYIRVSEEVLITYQRLIEHEDTINSSIIQ